VQSNGGRTGTHNPAFVYNIDNHGLRWARFTLRHFTRPGDSPPLFYWGEAGNVMTPSLFKLPIPASRSRGNTGYGFVLPDQNGWSRSLHFQTAWLLLFTGALYTAAGLLNRHCRDNFRNPVRPLITRNHRDTVA
jgi:hypothetical protein